MVNLVLISCSEDGDHRVEVIEEAVLLTRLNEKYYGENPRFLHEANVRQPSGGTLDLNYAHGYILIRGEVIQPKAKTVVNEFTL
jgi:hypothetical protein